MKSELYNYTPPSNDVEYPVLKRLASGLVVLFTAPRKGVVVHADSETKMGFYSDCFYEGAYTPLPEGAGVHIIN
jgi:hypothetical protein